MVSNIISFPRLVQDGGVEGHALIFSWDSTKISTSFWETIDRKTLEPIKKKKELRNPTSKNKR